MGYATNVQQADGETTAETTHDIDPEHVYCTIGVTRPTDTFERNAVRISGLDVRSLEVEDSGTVLMRDDVGRALAAALSAHYETLDAERASG